MVLYDYQGRWTVKEAATERQFRGVRDDLDKLALACYFAEVTELLGEGNDQKYNADCVLTQREYYGIACGQKVVFTVSYNDYGDVSSIDVEFEDNVTQEQLSDMVTELLGRQPREDGKWHSDTATVSIVKKDGHPGILLEQFEVESAEDPNQY